MIGPDEIQAEALRLPVPQRAALAACLLDSLPPVLEDEDDGIAEALRRDAEMDRDPSMGMSMDQFLKAFGR